MRKHAAAGVHRAAEYQRQHDAEGDGQHAGARQYDDGQVVQVEALECHDDIGYSEEPCARSKSNSLKTIFSLHRDEMRAAQTVRQLAASASKGPARLPLHVSLALHAISRRSGSGLAL